MDGGVVAEKPTITRETLEQAMQTDVVRMALRQRAARVLPRAQGEAAKAGRVRLSKALRVEEGTRPGTQAQGGIQRAYARVAAHYPEDERDKDKGARLTPREILRRAARG